MSQFNCRSISVNSFNRLGQDIGISVVSRDSRVDRHDRFFLDDENGERKSVRFAGKTVQSIIRNWRGDCQALRKRLSSPALKKLARAFGVKLGPPLIQADDDVERFGIFKKGKHLFDVDAGEGVFSSARNEKLDPLAPPKLPSAEEIYGGKPRKQEFKERHLAKLISSKLGTNIPLAYRAKVSMKSTDLRLLKKRGVKIHAGRELIEGPMGERFFYGGTLELGFTEKTTITIVGENMLKITMTDESGHTRSSLFPLKAKPAAQGATTSSSTALETDPEVEYNQENVIRDNRDAKKKKVIEGPGISITVYD